MAERTLYDILELQRTASKAEIREAFHRLAKQYHPDRNKNDAEAVKRYKEVVDAYETLSDAKRRRLYDAELKSPTAGGSFTPGAAPRPTKEDKGRVSAGSTFSELFGGKRPVRRPINKPAPAAGQRRTATTNKTAAEPPPPQDTGPPPDYKNWAAELGERERQLAIQSAALQRRESELSLREEKLFNEAADLGKRAAELERKATMADASPEDAKRLAELDQLAADLRRREEQMALSTSKDEARQAELLRVSAELATANSEIQQLRQKIEVVVAEQDGRARHLDWRAGNLKEREEKLIAAISDQSLRSNELNRLEADLRKREKQISTA